MKAAIYKGIGKIEVEEVPTPDREGLLFRVLYVGICGTDIKTFKRGHPLFTPPCILGHEFVGEFDGKIYTVAPYIECGECKICNKGLGELCQNKFWVDGALSEYVKVPEEIFKRAVFEVPEDVDPRVFTFTEPLACVIHGAERARISEKATLLIVGGGFMGLLFAIFLENMGCNVLITEIDSLRREKIKNFGFNIVSPEEIDPEKNKGVFDSVILANDREDIVDEFLPFVSPGGTFLLFGGMAKDAKISISPYFIHYKEVDIVGSFGFATAHFEKAYKIIKTIPDRFSLLISKEFSLDKIMDAFIEAQNKENIKVIVKITS